VSNRHEFVTIKRGSLGVTTAVQKNHIQNPSPYGLSKKSYTKPQSIWTVQKMMYKQKIMCKKNLNELINVRPERVSNCVCILYCVYTVCILCAFDKQNIDDNNHNKNNKPFDRLIAVTPERMSKCVCILYCVYTVCILHIHIRPTNGLRCLRATRIHFF